MFEICPVSQLWLKAQPVVRLLSASVSIRADRKCSCSFRSTVNSVFTPTSPILSCLIVHCRPCQSDTFEDRSFWTLDVVKKNQYFHSLPFFRTDWAKKRVDDLFVCFVEGFLSLWLVIDLTLLLLLLLLMTRALCGVCGGSSSWSKR